MKRSLCEAQLTGAATFCYRRKNCLAWAGSAIGQECTRRQEAGEQQEITQRLMAEEIQYQLQPCSCIFLQNVKGIERTRLWGKDWSAWVSPVTALLLPLSGCQWPLTTGKINQCHSRAGEHPAAEEGSSICCSSKEKLEAVLAEVGKSQVIAVYKANAETSYCLCQIKVPNPLKTDLHTPVSQEREQPLAHTKWSLQQAVLKEGFI